MGITTLLQRAALRLMLLLPRPIRRLIAGRQRVHEGQALDLDAQLLARLDQLLGGSENPARGTPEQVRALMRRGALSVAGPRPALALERSELVAGANGLLRARRYVPHQAAAGGALILYFHGGGWVLGDLETHDAPCRGLAQATGATVISVDYRLAPEHPFPAPVDDAFAAFCDVVARAEEFGAHPERIVVAGDSAGGHLSAMVAQRAVAGGVQAPAAQVLVYPVCDFTTTYASELAFADGLLLTKADMDWFTAHFLTDQDQRHAASPIHGELDGLPPAMVLTAGFDPLRDEGEAYAAAMQEAGVEVVLRRYADQTHGFFNALGVGYAAHEAIGEVAGVLRAWGLLDHQAAVVANAERPSPSKQLQ